MMFTWTRSLLGRNVALLIALVMVSQISVVVVFMLFVQKPRIADAATMMASQILTIDHLLERVPESQRLAYAAWINGQTEVPEGTSLTVRTSLLSPIRALESRWFVQELLHRLPRDMKVRFQFAPQHRLWAQVHIAKERYWVSLSELSGVPAGDYAGMSAAIGLSLALSGFATFAAYLLHRRINRPLKHLVLAAQRVGDGRRPTPVPVEGPTEIATVAQAFNRMTQRLAENESARAMMLAGISHDIRTPLTKLRLAIVMPENPGTGLRSAERFIDDIDAIVQQFIDFARGSGHEERVTSDLNELSRQLVADFAGLGHTFEMSLTTLPKVRFRRVEMLRLLMNLMQNAVVYGRVGLAVCSGHDDDFVWVAVQDRGPGVAQELLPVLTQPFRRGPRVQERAGGAGLGLAIAKDIASHHGGSIQLASRVGGGFEVRVKLPLN
ncbi:ATP-binding protein [Pararobbsia alpina]|uniref:histidine kinase n=1 Tax=Pararobbsia alpina TaxID=621374 RepID=A0A6S7BL05_9BURK|nr:ATP-binding protein [Pararobbsia alpina]CAB3802603.1 Adaptive-response sensory-kinase SasA [Pararobbsia alpina]